jgi:phytoene dehydrogenase-like protein
MGSIDPSIIIIGAGVAGLSAGVYAQLNGYAAQIFEMHNLPGGMVTSWERDGYLIDGCLELLNGSNPDSRMHALWEELGVSRTQRSGDTQPRREFIDHAELTVIRDYDGKELVLHADIDRLESDLLKLSPADSRLIREITAAIRDLAAYDPPLDANPLEMIFELPKMMRWLKTFNQYNQHSIEAFAEKFRDPFLGKAFASFMPQGAPMGTALGTLAFQANRNMGYPLGGSLALAQDIARRFTTLGGTLNYRTRVVEILTEKGRRGDRATGVLLEDGRVLHADMVISAGDGYNAVYHLLGGRYIDDETSHRYQHMPLTPSSVQIALGTTYDFSHEPHSQVDLLRQPLYFAGKSHKYIRYQHFNFDPSMAPERSSVIISRIRSDYDYWKGMAQEPTRYESEKLSTADVLIHHLEKRYPGISGEVELVDVATPLTFERYTGARQGVYQSFALTPQTAVFAQNGMEPTLPGLDGFYQIGQWIQPGGGVFLAARSGREIIRRVCKQDGKRFSFHETG